MTPNLNNWISNVRRINPGKFVFSSVAEFVHPGNPDKLKDRFKLSKYTGIVGDRFPDDGKQYDVIVSNEMLQFDKNWQLTLHRMHLYLKERGLLIIIAAGWQRHKPTGADWYEPMGVAKILSAFGVTPAKRSANMSERTLFTPGDVNYIDVGETIVYWGIKV